MTIQTTRWSPDTCGCVIVYSWDNAVAQSSRTHTLSSITKCPAHTAQTNANAYTACVDENIRKNDGLQTALNNGPSTLYNMNGTQRVLRPTITYNHSWSGTAPNRVLTISFTGITLTTTEKNTIQTAENTRFGSGKVSVV